MSFVEKGRYRLALEKLWKNSKRFRQCCRSLISLVVKKETKGMIMYYRGHLVGVSLAV